MRLLEWAVIQPNWYPCNTRKVECTQEGPHAVKRGKLYNLERDGLGEIKAVDTLSLYYQPLKLERINCQLAI